MDLDRFFAELKRRHVFRVAGTYAVALFAAVQVLEALVGFFPVLNAIGTMIVVVGLLGFPATVALAWVFDITPQGVRRTEALPDAGSAPAGARRVLTARHAAGFVGMGIIVAIVGLAAIPAVTGNRLTELAAPASIAVLPFADLSPEGDQQIFGDGIADELLNRLAQTTELQVAARSSSFALRDAGLDAEALGEQLHVDAILEGSIRSDGENVRVSAQLSDARNGRLIWSHSYDRPKASVLALQDEIALAIVENLQAELQPQAQVAEGETAPAAPPRLGGSTHNAEAYELYRRGLDAWHRRTEASVRTAIQRFEEALALDDEYALAWAGLAQAYVVLPQISSEPPRAAVGRAKTAAASALGLVGNLPEALVAMGQIAQNYDWRLRRAENFYERALEANPSYATAHQWYGETLLMQGRYEEARAQIARAVELDRLSAAPLTVRGYMAAVLGDQEAALEDFRAVARTTPDFPVAAFNHGVSATLTGAGAEAKAAFGRMAAGDAALRRALERIVDGALDPAAGAAGREAAGALRGRLAPGLVAV